MLAGKTAVVCGYGDVEKDQLRVFEDQGLGKGNEDPICALQAAMDGFEVIRIEDTLETADVFITATGNKDVNGITDHMRKMETRLSVILDILIMKFK